MKLLISLFCLLFIINNSLCQRLNPENIAPNFTLPTLSGPIVYKGSLHKDTNIKPPIIFHEFTNHSGFLECLWTKKSSLLELIDNSPDNTQYVFLSSANNATELALWMKKKFKEVLDEYYLLAENISKSFERPGNTGYGNITEESAQRRSFENILQRKVVHHVFPIPRRRIDKRSINSSYPDIPKVQVPKVHKSSHSRKRYKRKLVTDWSTVDLPKIRKPSVLKRTKYKNEQLFKWKNYASKHENLKRESLKHDHIPSYLKPFHEHLTFDNKKNKKRSIIYHLRSEIADEELANEEVDTTALHERVKNIMNKRQDGFVDDWLKRLHFVTVPLYEVGNWIPLVMSRWYCSGHGCGLDQIAVEGKDDGDVRIVSKRLDGRYDWVPSPYILKSKHPRLKISSLGDGCNALPGEMQKNLTGQFALISREGTCSYYTKIKNAQREGALAAIIYTSPNEPLVDMTCEGSECEEEMKIPATMIPYKTGKDILEIIEDKDIYVKFQHTPSRNFFVAIDEQGKLQEVGWLLYPSMIFLSYQAKWLNYKTALLRNISNMNADVITVFNASIMQGVKGVSRIVYMPAMKDLQRYKHIYLDMALDCPGTSDFTCPHWDHTVQLYACCNKTSPLCNKEIGRWITPFRRRIGRWLTNIQPLLPMISSSGKSACNFTMKTVPWAMPWKPALKLRLAQKEQGRKTVPYQVIPLFRGGKFDKDYNKRGIRTLNITIPDDVAQVKFFATITGHGSDNNNCAEFCVTSHHFIINEKHKNTRIFDTAGTATGCADRVSEGSEPNEHGTWLYGRDGWCDGQNVSPWVEDISQQVDRGKINMIRYYGHFNDTDPDPTSNPGNIIMYSYLILYKDIRV